MSTDREVPLPSPSPESGDGTTASTAKTRGSRAGRKRRKESGSIWGREPRASDDPIRMAGLLPPIPCLMVIVSAGGTVVAASRLLRDRLATPLLGRDLDAILEMPKGIVWLEGEPSDTLVVEGAKLVHGDGSKRTVTLHGGWRVVEGERLFFGLFELEQRVRPAGGPPGRVETDPVTAPS